MAQVSTAQTVPVTVLTGFLGSGKTTLLNHILNDMTHGMRFAVIENEFGEVGIDENILSENVDEEIIEVMNGCICCTVRGDLVKVLKKLHEKVEDFDGVIIETTGLADPAPVVQTFFIDGEVRQMYSLDSVITVTDAKHIVGRLNEQKPDGVENEAVEQIVFADKIILNKTDLVSEEDELKEIESRIRGLNRHVPIIRSQFSKVDPSELLNIRAFDLDRVLEFEPDFLGDDQEHKHDLSIVSTSRTLEGELNIDMLSNWIRRLLTQYGANLYRYKGVMAVKGRDEKFVFQGVGMLFNGGFESSWRRGEKRESRFVFIGKNLDVEFLNQGIEACLVTKELRFAVGARVRASVGEGEYAPGRVIRQWDEGNAYRIRLIGGTEVWAPIDVDAYVRPYEKK